jgi:hypothetical protein
MWWEDKLGCGIITHLEEISAAYLKVISQVFLAIMKKVET